MVNKSIRQQLALLVNRQACLPTQWRVSLLPLMLKMFYICHTKNMSPGWGFSRGADAPQFKHHFTYAEQQVGGNIFSSLMPASKQTLLASIGGAGVSRGSNVSLGVSI